MQALFEHICELVSKARTLILMPSLTSTISEGDVPHYRIVVRNVIRSGFGAALAAVLLVACPFEFGRAPTDTTVMNLKDFTKSVTDPCATKGSCATLTETNGRKCHISGQAETKSVDDPSTSVKGSCAVDASSGWEYHIIGPAELSKSVDDPFAIERRSTVAFEKHCNAEITQSIADPFVLVEGSTAA